jgi:hypothetical protein
MTGLKGSAILFLVVLGCAKHREVVGGGPPVALPCQDGQVRGPDTSGHCCWEGQAWNGFACVGLPLSCPAGLRVSDPFEEEGCTSEPCQAGQALVDGLHCCFRGTAWSSASERCVGEASCPDELRSFGPFCVEKDDFEGMNWKDPGPTTGPAGTGPDARGRCPQGQFLVGDRTHCCPGYWGWSTPRGRCIASSWVQVGPVERTPIILGNLDRAHLEKGIAENFGQIRRCYEERLVKDPDLAGIVEMKFMVAKDGSVSSAMVKRSSLRDSEVEECLVDRLLYLRFTPRNGGGIVGVSYPFVFQPE